MSVGRRSNAPILFQRRCPDRPPPACTHALPWRPPNFCRPHRRIHRSCPRDALAPRSWLRSRSLIRSGCGIHERRIRTAHGVQVALRLLLHLLAFFLIPMSRLVSHDGQESSGERDARLVLGLFVGEVSVNRPLDLTGLLQELIWCV